MGCRGTVAPFALVSAATGSGSLPAMMTGNGCEIPAGTRLFYGHGPYSPLNSRANYLHLVIGVSLPERIPRIGRDIFIGRESLTDRRYLQLPIEIGRWRTVVLVAAIYQQPSICFKDSPRRKIKESTPIP
jgi:hypothetical protein